MSDLVLTGASRGIGRALALALPTDLRVVLVARDASRLADVAAAVQARGGRALVVPADLGSVASARAAGRRLADLIEPGATLVHNAGLWPARRALSPEGLEAAFVVNHLAPLALQQPLLDAGRLRRLFVVSAGLLVKGRWDPARTPTGEDFSGLRTYCTTKLCLALAAREVAAAHPTLDVAVAHPGVVRTDLGARAGVIGWLLRFAKRGWESPEDCAARLARVLARPRWSTPGHARWYFEEREDPWPAAADDLATRRSVWAVSARLLEACGAGVAA